MRLPLVPGIDFAGTVLASEHAGFAPGDDVILNGWGCGERRPGGYAERARVPGDWLIKRPAVFTNAETMAIGTAGYTAMLAVLALEDHGVTPDKGPVLVTGAAGGVGSVAVALLHKLGYRVIASTGTCRRRRTICAASALRRSSPATSCRRRRAACSAKSAGRAPSTLPARTRWPMPSP